MTTNERYGRDTCYFCHHPDSAALEHHHVHPQRFGGPDDAENLVTVCANCHRKLESLYDDSFYAALGVEIESGDEQIKEDFKVVVAESGSVKTVPSIIDDIEDDYAEGAPVNVVKKKAIDRGMDADMVDHEVEKLKQKGEVYEPRTDHLRTTS